MSMAPPAAALLEEILEEILFRLPPDDPAHLVHAALVCKAWCRVVADRGFRRRYCEFHRSAPILGFFHTSSPFWIARFAPTSSFHPRHADLSNWVVKDVRHGRVLLRREVERGPAPAPDAEDVEFVVWDPITDAWTALPRLKRPLRSRVEYVCSAAVMCAGSKSGTCDHLDCHDGPTLAVFVVGFVSKHDQMSVRVYSSDSEGGSWSEPVDTVALSSFSVGLKASTLAGNLLYLELPYAGIILKYNLDTQKVSEIHRPPKCLVGGCIALMTTEDGRLQLANVDNFSLYLWTREDGHGGDAGWSQKVIDLNKLVPASPIRTSPYIVGAADGIAAVFLQTRGALFIFDLKSEKATMVCTGDFNGVLPYMSFCTPVIDLASRNEGPSASASSVLTHTSQEICQGPSASASDN